MSITKTRALLYSWQGENRCSLYFIEFNKGGVHPAKICLPEALVDDSAPQVGLFRDLKTISNNKENDYTFEGKIQGEYEGSLLIDKVGKRKSAKELFVESGGKKLKLGATVQPNYIEISKDIKFGTASPLNSEVMYFSEGQGMEQTALFKTNLLDDIIHRSTIEYDADGSRSSFTLSYFKTSNFDSAGVKISSKIEKELFRVKKFIVETFSSKINIHKKSQICIQIIGHADGVFKKIKLDDLNRRQAQSNHAFALNRAKAVHKWLDNNIDGSIKSTCILLSPEACDEKYFDKKYYKVDDRSVQIKIWLRDQADQTYNVSSY